MTAWGGVDAAAGVKKLTTETGAGQWGSALAFATCLLDMECEVSEEGSSKGKKAFNGFQQVVSLPGARQLMAVGALYSCCQALQASKVVLVAVVCVSAAWAALCCRCGRCVPAMMPSPTGRP